MSDAALILAAINRFGVWLMRMMGLSMPITRV